MKRRRQAPRHRKVATLGALVTLRSDPEGVGTVTRLEPGGKVVVVWDWMKKSPSGRLLPIDRIYPSRMLRALTPAEQAAWRLR